MQTKVEVISELTSIEVLNDYKMLATKVECCSEKANNKILTALKFLKEKRNFYNK